MWSGLSSTAGNVRDFCNIWWIGRVTAGRNVYGSQPEIFSTQTDLLSSIRTTTQSLLQDPGFDLVILFGLQEAAVTEGILS